MDIKDFLLPADVLCDLRASDKSRLLQDLSQRAAAALDLNGVLVADALLKREELGSTGVGGGVAIPHARLAEVEKPFGLMARLKKPIDFDAIDGQPVDIVFVLLLPASPAGEQLNALAAVARKLRKPEIASALRSASDPAGIHSALTSEARQQSRA
jgi:PTS system nitrogen regulatory IIA component